MKRLYIKKGILLVPFCCLMAVLTAMAATRPTAGFPDFAYPKDVQAQADADYLRAMREDNPVLALRSAMMLNIADSKLTPDSIGVSVGRYREIERKFAAPWRDLSMLLEAQLLADMYSSDRYMFDRRTLPVDSPDPEPLLWSGDQIKARVAELIGKVESDATALDSMPVGEIGSLINGLAQAERDDMTVYDFAAYRMLDLISRIWGFGGGGEGVIPFGCDVASSGIEAVDPAASPDAAAIVEHLIAVDAARSPDSAATLYARFKLLDITVGDVARREYADRLLELYPEDSVWFPDVVWMLSENGLMTEANGFGASRRRALLEESLKRESSVQGCLRHELDMLLQPYTAITVPSTVTSKSPFRLIAELKNMAEVYAVAVKVPTSEAAEAQNSFERGKEVRCLGHFTVDSASLTSRYDTITIPPLEPGYYIVAPSKTPDKTGVLSGRAYSRAVIHVTDLMFFTSQQYRKDQAGSKRDGSQPSDSIRVYTVSAYDGKPIPGVALRCRTSDGRKESSRYDLTSNKEGYADIRGDIGYVVATHDGSEAQGDVYSYVGARRRVRYAADILTDLALYHPGDTVRGVVIVAENRDNLLSPARGARFSLVFRDANYNDVERKALAADSLGRAAFEFAIPADRLTGSYSLQTVFEAADDVYDAYSSVEVAEYKAPTVLATLGCPELKNGRVAVTGTVTTYTGMPIAGAEVTVDIRFLMSWWKMRMPYGVVFSRKVTTDASGRYELMLDTSPLDGKGYDGGYFRVEATAVVPAGESASADPQCFAIGSHYAIQASDISVEATGEEIRVPVRVVDIIGNPVDTDLEYTILEPSGKTRSGICRTPALALGSSETKNGTYRVTFRLPEALREDGADGSVSIELTVWRMDAYKPPVETPLWVPKREIYAEKGEDTVRIPVGSSYEDSWIYAEVSDCDRILRREWLKVDARNRMLEVAAPVEGEAVQVTFVAVHDAAMRTAIVRVLPYEASVRPKIKVDTFRDRISSGSTETWKFTFEEEGHGLPYTGMTAVLSNASLNALVPFSWSVSPERIQDYSCLGRVSVRQGGTTGTVFGYGYVMKGYDSTPCGPTMPVWNLWNQRLFASYGLRRYKGGVEKFAAVRGSAAGGVAYDADGLQTSAMAYGVAADESVMMTSAAPMMANVMADMGDEAVEEEVSADTSVPDGTAAEADKASYRAMECPLAFFRPLMTTDAEGCLEVEFEVPDFNTTWQFQLLGYDDRMRTALYRNQTVSAKPVMVTTQMPRFALTYDKLQIPATVFNNTDRPLDLRARIEAVEPQSGRVIAFTEETFTEVAPAASRVMALDLAVPSDVGMLTVRSTVSASVGSDGEQGPLVVLPSSQPVMKTTTFYLAPKDTTLSVTLPETGPDDLVTLNYCANPSWYVLTSLSGLLTPDSESALVQANALYANAVGHDILRRYPVLREALKSAVGNSDSTLVSPLEQNGDLKLTDLLNTPWVNDGSSETRRMHSLTTLTDSVEVERSLAAILESLSKTQKPGGGWAWMPKMGESLYITKQVLLKFGMLRRLGLMPEPAAGMADSGLAFADKEEGRLYHTTVYKDKMRYPLSAEIDYQYMRGLLTTGAPSGYIAEMRRDMFRRLPGEWKSLDLYHKATAAILLHKEGMTRLAKDVLTSVAQYSQYTREKGMWFDRGGDYCAQPPYTLNARVLEAYGVIDPASEDVERLCQYLVLTRQVEDWNLNMSESQVAEVADAVVGVSSGWSRQSAGVPVITLDGEPVALPADAGSLAGNFYLDLTPGQTSGKVLEVSRQAGEPAWGGVMRQAVRKPSEVKAQGVPQLKVEKMLLPIDEQGGRQIAGKAATHFRKGDRIRVTLTVVTDRDLDYVMLTDRLGAFMQPAEQLTSYELNDGVWLLRETRRAATNFFITSLPKGKYVISYDVTADRDGEYSTGIATAQSQYYPLITAHSAGAVVTVAD